MSRQRKVILNILCCCNRHPGSNLSNDWNACYCLNELMNILGILLSQQFYCTRFRRIAADKPFLLQPVQMAMYRGAGSQSNSFADFPDRRRITLAADFVTYKFQDRQLATRNL
ncbi:hypothetical protein D3C85_1568950 [compost metagenome]